MSSFMMLMKWAVWVMGWAVGYVVGGPWDYSISYLGQVIDIGRCRPRSLTIFFWFDLWGIKSVLMQNVFFWTIGKNIGEQKNLFNSGWFRLCKNVYYFLSYYFFY